MSKQQIEDHRRSVDYTLVVDASISREPLCLKSAVAAVDDARSGAIATFIGQVRNHDHGVEVTRLDYSAHPSAEQIIKEVAKEVARRQGLQAIWVKHRVGRLEIGEAALMIAVSAAHRTEAFVAVADLVDQVKARVPIWKCQYFPDGTHEWSECP